MTSLFKGHMPGIYPATLHLNELKAQMDEEVIKRGSPDQQMNIYRQIQEMECIIKGWMFQSSKQLDYLQD